MSIAWVFGLIALSIVLSFALTLILGFEDIPNDEDEEGEAIANKDVVNKEKAEEQETVLEPAKPASA